MMVILLLCMMILEGFQCWQLTKLVKLLQSDAKKSIPKEPPKARNSFVVKRMEERLKEALYE